MVCQRAGSDDEVFGFGNRSQHLASSRIVRVSAHQKVHDFVLLLALELSFEREIVRVELSLVFLAGANFVQAELFDRFDGVVAGQEKGK